MINYTMKHKNNIRTYSMIELFPDVGIETKFLQVNGDLEYFMTNKEHILEHIQFMDSLNIECDIKTYERLSSYVLLTLKHSEAYTENNDIL